MTRKSVLAILVCLTQLAALPGCLHLSYFNPAGKTGPKQPSDAAEVRSTDGPELAKSIKDQSGFSTANLSADSSQSTSKMPAATLKEKLPGPVILDQQPDTIGPKKSDDATTGVVTVESGPEPKRLFVQPTPLPLLEKKREDALLQALKSLIEKRHDEAIQYLRVYDKETQEFFIRFLPVLTLVAQKPFNELTPQEIAVVNEQLLSALLMLRPRTELLVSRMCFCKEVRGYGWYQPLPENHAFVTGTKDRLGEEVQLYVELKNFLSEKTKDGDYLTKLTCVLELQDSGGKKVWSHRFDRADAAHRRSAQLNDLYRNYTFYVPVIPPGTYQLTMQIADETHPEQRRVASEKLIFRVTPVAN